MRIESIVDLIELPLGEDITLIRYMRNNYGGDFIRLIIVKPNGKVYFNDLDKCDEYRLGCTSGKTQLEALINVYRYYTIGNYRELAFI